MKTEILYGIHPVAEALKAGRRIFAEIYITKDRTPYRLSEITEAAGRLNIPVRPLTASRLSELAGSEAHQGIGAKVGEYPLAALASMIEPDKERPCPCFLLLLDGIVDPQNMGALVRTALCAGIDAVVFPKDRSASPLPSVSKASAGAMEHLKMAMVTNLSAAIGELKHTGFWIAGLDRSADRSIYQLDLTGRVAIVIGGEEKGIRPRVKQQCDFLASIPQRTGFNSLNASAAGAVVIYEAVRQRLAG